VQNSQIGESIQYGKACLAKFTPDFYKVELQHYNLKNKNKELKEELRPI